MFQDFGLGAFWTLFWFFSACAFAAGVNALKDVVNIENLTKQGGAFNAPCSLNGFKCDGTNPKYATMTVAIVSYSSFLFYSNAPKIVSLKPE